MADAITGQVFRYSYLWARQRGHGLQPGFFGQYRERRYCGDQGGKIPSRVALSAAAAAAPHHANALFATRPVPSTNHFSLVNGLPASRAAIQSATRIAGAGPKLAEGTPPTECRESA